MSLTVLNDRRSELAETVDRFANERLRPAAAQLDQESEFPAAIYREMIDMGLFGLTVAEAHGGGGGRHADFVEVMESLAYGYASVADQLGLVEILSHLLSRYGNDTHIERWLRPLLTGDLRGAYALTEPEAGSDLAALRTTAERTGDGWTLRGEKVFIHNAPVADFALVLARTDPGSGTSGMSLFVAPLRDTQGITVTNKVDKMGQRASQLAGLHFNDVSLGGGALLGEVGRGFSYVMQGLNLGRIGIAALSLGISRAAIRAAREHATTRLQFGRPISDNQAIAFALADMATEYRAGRLLVADAARLADENAPSSHASSMAKLYCSEACVRHTSQAVQIHGGSGFIRGYEVERLYRDARITTIYEGTSEVQRMIISRALLG